MVIPILFGFALMSAPDSFGAFSVRPYIQISTLPSSPYGVQYEIMRRRLRVMVWRSNPTIFIPASTPMLKEMPSQILPTVSSYNIVPTNKHSLPPNPLRANK
ncbi:hypothetical protein F4774DRAFT_401174 [Daldinia eschscholtzii]|nr:hypothetical protein F4774DRAFT_401174 [Daldinia eschscholtzii]